VGGGLSNIDLHDLIERDAILADQVVGIASRLVGVPHA
jgi:hypothetical protein